MVTGYEAAYYEHIRQMTEHLKEIRTSLLRLADALELLVERLDDDDDAPLPPAPWLDTPPLQT